MSATFFKKNLGQTLSACLPKREAIGAVSNYVFRFSYVLAPHILLTIYDILDTWSSCPFKSSQL
jgi:hypothetical protein